MDVDLTDLKEIFRSLRLQISGQAALRGAKAYS